MDRTALAKELLKLAKAVSAVNATSLAEGKAAVAVLEYLHAVQKDKDIFDEAARKKIAGFIEDAIEALDKAGDVLNA